jgi:4-amino-4-deoxy-L-arabinose transferase-like glycosyltransferase
MTRVTPPRQGFAWGPVCAVAAVVGLVLVATSGAYGYHRDELYFRLLGQQPAWGYVDQPPATPLLARATVELLGDHLWALRLPGALILAATAILTALLARDLGGGRGAQVLAAAVSATLFPLVFGHVLLTATLDLVLGAGILLCVVRALLRDERWWLAVGLLVGLALYNKHLVVLTLVAIGVGLVLVGPRRVLWSRWLLAGVAIAVVVGAPNLIYQASHGWPQLEMARAIERNKGDESRILFLPLQLALVGVFLAPVWVAGLVHLLRDPALRPVRALAVAYPVLCVLVLATGGQPYYTAALVLALFAAGSIPPVQWMTGRPGRAIAFGAAFGASVALSALVALPVLPVAVLAATPIPDLNQATSDQIGWPAYVRQVAAVVRGLPAPEARRAVIVTANYGEAGALDRYGDPYALPAVFSGHNELWFRGQPPEGADVVIAVGFSPGSLDGEFESCQTALRLDNGVQIANEEQSRPVLVCRGPTRPWAELWPSFQHYD